MFKLKTLLRGASLLFLIWLFRHESPWGVIGIEKVFAQNLFQQDFINAVSSAVALLTQFLNMLMWILFWLLDLLLDPKFIFDIDDEAQGKGILVMLHSIWQLTRDLMNLIFAILLVVGAVYMIITTKKEFLKENLPKFIMAVILVNFSWFVPRAIYDLSQITAYTVFQLPALLNVQCDIPLPPGQAGPPEPCKILTGIALFEETRFVADTGVFNNPGNPNDPRKGGGWECPLKPIVCIQLRNFDAPNVALHSQIINGLVLNFARLRHLATVTAEVAAQAPAPDDDQITASIIFLMKMLLIVVIHIALFFPLVALVIVFLLRVPILWLTMAFMPVALLGLLLGDKLGQFNPVEKIWKRFLSAAFLPAMVAVPFAIGFIMTHQGLGVKPPLGLEQFGTGLPLFVGIRDFWQFVWMFLAIFVMWTGVFTVLKQSEIATSATETIKASGEAMGKFALQAPLALPFLPVPGKPGEKMAPLQALKALDGRRWLRELDDGRIEDLGGLLRGVTGRPPPAAEDRARQVIRENRADIQNTANVNIHLETVNNNQGNAEANRRARQDAAREIARGIRNTAHIRNDPQANRLAQEALLNLITDDRHNPLGLTREQRERLREAFNAAPPPAPAAPGPGGPPAPPGPPAGAP
jgi:hypothetical protein